MSSGAKKEKSFNGTKAKFSPNAAVPEKKAEVKLRRKDSEKVKQPSDPNRKSVLGRFFHNLVDSDDSRKKAAAADAKKKKGRDLAGSDLDLPEHGIVLRKNQTLQRDPQLVPSPRTRAMTLANQQGRDNRNRWSSYDIQASNFTEGMVPETVPETDYSTMGSMGHRSQSEETLNALLSADPRPMSRVKDGFVTRTDSGRQPDTMRKHAQLLQSIQETKTNRLSRSDKTIDALAGQGSNGYLLTTEMVIDGQKKDVTGNNADQKLNDSQKASSCDIVDANRELRPQNQTATSSSDTSVLLEEKDKQINKAMADKRRILCQLFGVAEEDLNSLLEKDVDLSSDVSVRKMILISLLQSDQLTSAISGLLVPPSSGCTDGAVDKEAAIPTGDKLLKENASSSQSRLLHKVASRLHGHLTLLQQIVDRDVSETDRLKKDLEAAQLRIKMKSIPSEEAKPDLADVSLRSDDIVQQNADLSISTEAQGGSIESPSNTVDKVTESASEQDSQAAVNIDENVADKNENSEEVLPVAEELLNIIEHVKEEQVISIDSDDKTDIKLSSDVSQNISPHVEECVEAVDAEVHSADEVIILDDKDTSDQHQEISDLLFVSSDDSTSDVDVPAEVKDDYQTNFQDVNDNLEKLVNEGNEVDDSFHSDVNRKFMNLESIPEDDDRLSCCEVELKVCASENLYQEIVLKCDHLEVTVEDDVEPVLSTKGETHSDVRYDAISVVKDNDIQPDFKVDLLLNANDVSSAVTDGMQCGVGDVQLDLVDKPLLNMQDDFRAIVHSAVSNVLDAPPSGLSNTPLHANDDSLSGSADGVRSDTHEDTRTHTEDEDRSKLDEIQTSVGDGEDSCQGHTPVNPADIITPESGDNLGHTPAITPDITLESGDNLGHTPAITPDITLESGDNLDHTPAITPDITLESGDNLDHTQVIKADVTSDSGDNLPSCQGLESIVIEFPQISASPENLESQQEEHLDTEQDDLEMDTDAQASVQLEKESSSESEIDGESESEDERRSEPDVLKILEPSSLESERKESVGLEVGSLPGDLENANEQILYGSDIAFDELAEVEEISHSDIILEDIETVGLSEPRTVVEEVLLHNHVENENTERNEEASQENTKGEISEVVNELLDLSECDKITIVS